MTGTIDFDSFLQVEIRAGTVIAADYFPEAKKPAYKLLIDFGPQIGHKKSSAQITANYTPAELTGRQVLAVTNFPPRQIGPFMSEVLTLGLADDAGAIVLACTDAPVPNGARLI